MLLSYHACQWKQGFAALRKTRERWREDTTKNVDFCTEIEEKPKDKSRKTAFAARIDKKTLPGTAFLGKNRFSMIFGAAGGTQNSLKTSKKIIMRSIWGHFLCQSFPKALSSLILALRRVPGARLGGPETRFLVDFLGYLWDYCMDRFTNKKKMVE